ncbi:pentatricopeptide repeat-containing protein At3g13880-like isoform X2 [Malus domestica]|uniref:pentatricopeptide repeat-containing protein At3g13880-like isoform X2 n=1 Tax=Malus domestica TaxID=3750 RepID=UPI003974A536
MLLHKSGPPKPECPLSIQLFYPLVSNGQVKEPSKLPQPAPTPQQCSQLCHPNYSLDNVAYTKLVQHATKTGSSLHGKLAHAHIIKTSFKPCMFLLNNLLTMYSRLGEFDSARHLFDRMPKRNLISYNSLISGYNEVGLFDKAMGVFNEAKMAGLKLDRFTYAGALSVCGQTGDFELGKLVHGLIVVNALGSEVVLTNSLIDMYSKCGRVDHARNLFQSSDNLDLVSWNSLIACYARIGANEETLTTLVKMHQCGLSLNTYTLGSALKACGKILDNSGLFGKILHGYNVKLGLDLDVAVGTALLDMYAKTCGLGEAIQIFKFMPYRNVVLYNAMIAGFLQIETFSYGHANEVFNLLSEMQRLGIKPSTFTFSIILRACKSVEALEYGKQVHTQVYKYDLQGDEFIGSGLIDVYCSLGLSNYALRCFNLTPRLDIVSWTSMVAGYIQNGEIESAFDLFYRLLESGMKPDEFIISSMLGACADLAAARSGEQIQGYAVKAGFGKFTVVQNSQICIKAQHGCANEALNLFELMKTCGIAPNHITFLGVLTACSHGGLVEEGLRYFETMKKDYGMSTNVEHCACVVDLLGRAGRLADAEKFIFNSSFEDNPVMWRALLSACRVYMDTVAAKRVAEKLIDLEPQAAASYVLLYNIYNDAAIELPAKRIRELMKNRGVKKEPGLSWIEVGNKVHSFVSGDRSHQMVQLIYTRLVA